MSNNQTIRKLNEMKLYGMTEEFEIQLNNPGNAHLAFEDRFGFIVDHEETYRKNKRLQSLLSRAKFKFKAHIEDLKYSPDRGLDRSFIASLSNCNWIKKGSNLLITGATGSGKTWVACALGTQACMLGLSVAFIRLPLLVENLLMAHGDNSFIKLINKYSKVDLLIIDDFGLSSLTATARQDLFELIEPRAESKSFIITSQLPVDKWHDFLSGGKNQTIADAILDRLVGSSYRINLTGESMRPRQYENL